MILIPPSPAAPHMVDGRYRGRGDRTNIVLGDAEVARIRGETRSHLDDAVARLREYAPQAINRRRPQATLLAMVACPSIPREEMVLDAAQPEPRKWLAEKLLRGPLTAQQAERYSPDFNSGIPISPRANGWAIAHEGDVTDLELEVHEDGVMRLRAGDFDSEDRDNRAFVNDVAINGLVRRLVQTAGVLGRECSYLGSWDFALVIAPLRGQKSLSLRHSMNGRLPYSEEGYEASVSATLEQIEDDLDDVHRRLLGRLNRAFGGANPLVLK